MHTYIVKPKIFPPIAVLCPNNADLNTLDKCDGQGMYGSFFVAEMVGTFIFVNVILSVKYMNGAKDLLVNALGIGITLMLSISITGGISGGCINPAVGLIQSIYQNFIVQEYPETFTKIKDISLISTWVYVLAPTLGGVLAGMFQHFNSFAQHKLHDSQVKDHMKKWAMGMQNKGAKNRNKDFR